MGKIKKITKKISNNDGGFYTFLRAQFTSQISSATDFLSTFIFAIVLNVYYPIATFLGSVLGGIVNLTLNYKWSFKATGVNKKNVILKFLIVWGVSILLNTFGTFALTEWVKRFHSVEQFFGYFVDDVFIFVKAFVSLIVGFGWNYTMNKYFVYRNVNIGNILTK